MRKKIVAGNWKMNLNMQEAIALAKAVNDFVAMNSPECEVILFPSFLHVLNVKNKTSAIAVGTQNLSSFSNGAYTGEVSASMLSDDGIRHSLVGHSERRAYFGEHSDLLLEKIQQCLKHSITPVYCFGEPLPVRDSGNHYAFVKKQLEETVFRLNTNEFQQLVLAYEPIWAIGTGVNATREQAQEMHHFVRNQIAKRYDSNTATEMRILYGGSCKPGNAAELFACPDVDGGLIGGASLNADDFIALIKHAG